MGSHNIILVADSFWHLSVSNGDRRQSKPFVVVVPKSHNAEVSGSAPGPVATLYMYIWGGVYYMRMHMYTYMYTKTSASIHRHKNMGEHEYDIICMYGTHVRAVWAQRCSGAQHTTSEGVEATFRRSNN